MTLSKSNSNPNDAPARIPTWGRWFLFLLVFFLLFFALGQRALNGSEDRWAEIARNMLLHGDWWHPIINGEVYFDKPLLSYWLIVLCSLGGQLSEWTIRLPGALAALLSLFCTYKIAAQWFDRSVAWLSAWLLLTSYGFLFWSHTASAELSNVALITAALAWFVAHRDRHDFLSYLGFYVLCALGSQLKGLTALVVPALVVAPYVFRQGRWRQHICLPHLWALLVAAGVFFIPYWAAATQALPDGVQAQTNHLSGLDLLIRENVVRFFKPFDHVEPFYSYLYAVPRIVFPWVFLFLAALIHYGKRFKTLNESQRGLLESIALIFLFFTLSGSRRWYYILPIAPFCMMLTAAYLTQVSQASDNPWPRRALRATLVLLAISGALLLCAPSIAAQMANELTLPVEFLIGSAVLFVTGALLIGVAKKRPLILQHACGIKGPWADHLPLLCVLAALQMGVLFGFFLPGSDRYRPLKPFALSLAKQAQTDERWAFYKKENTTLAFYLNASAAIPTVNDRTELSGAARSWILIAEKKDQAELLQSFPELRNANPVLEEKSVAESRLSSRNQWVAYRLALPK